jgi:hypothetical protein
MPKSRTHKNARDRARRALKKKAKKGTEFRIRKSSGDLVAIQLSIRTKKAVPKKWLTRALLDQMIRRKAETSQGQWDGYKVAGAVEGVDPTGIKIAIIRWRNPDRLVDEDTGWRYADPDSPSEQADAWGSLRRVIQTAALSIRLDR